MTDKWVSSFRILRVTGRLSMEKYVTLTTWTVINLITGLLIYKVWKQVMLEVNIRFRDFIWICPLTNVSDSATHIINLLLNLKICCKSNIITVFLYRILVSAMTGIHDRDQWPYNKILSLI